MGPGRLDAAAAAEAVRGGVTTAGALLDDARSRAQEVEPALGAVVTPVERLAADASGPLAGVVLGVKDLIAVRGMPRQCGAPHLVDTSPQEADATVVARASASSATVFATLATHPLAFGIITPQTNNPAAPDRMAGGSSGGAAAAVAAGFVHVALGTDTGGSVRIPAACCGVVGLKTTRGLVPLTGVHDLAWSLDTVGPLAACVADARLLLEVIAGHDPDDPVSEHRPADPHQAGQRGAAVRPAGLRREGPRRAGLRRVGVPVQVRGQRLDPEVRAAWEATLAGFAADGVEVTDVDLPLLDRAPTAAGRILAAEAAAVHRDAFAAHPASFPADVAPRLAVGVDLDAVTVARARRHGTLLRAALREAFQRVDVLCTPTLPCRVPRVGADPVVVDGEPEPLVKAVTRLTNAWNLAGAPAGSVPAGTDADGAPIGMQLIGPWWDEATVLDAMALVERRAARTSAPADR
ncbi:MAG: amidase [Euzebyales bacterium]|nr:amidase [Euzebyales bacterium]